MMKFNGRPHWAKVDSARGVSTALSTPSYQMMHHPSWLCLVLFLVASSPYPIILADPLGIPMPAVISAPGVPHPAAIFDAGAGS